MIILLDAKKEITPWIFHREDYRRIKWSKIESIIMNPDLGKKGLHSMKWTTLNYTFTGCLISEIVFSKGQKCQKTNM